MSIDETTTVAQAQRTAARVIEGKAVVVVIDDQVLHSLNAVGTFIWERADGRTVGAIVDALAQEFDVDRTTAKSDALRFLRELVEAGAVELGGSSA